MFTCIWYKYINRKKCKIHFKFHRSITGSLNATNVINNSVLEEVTTYPLSFMVIIGRILYCIAFHLHSRLIYIYFRKFPLSILQKDDLKKDKSNRS